MKSLAIITGASRGIGLAIAQKFLAEGWAVINLSRTASNAKGILNHSCDITDNAATEQVLAALNFAPYARVSLIHNAAMLQHDTVSTLTETDFLRVLKLNVVVPQFINRRLIPQLPKSSSILCIGSTLSEIGVPNLLSYVTSKHAMAGLMKATAQDLAGTGIHTCLICPGFTDTQMLRDSVGENVDVIKERVLFQRLVEPKEIAELVYFCSLNPAINGAVLHANLGQKN